MTVSIAPAQWGQFAHDCILLNQVKTLFEGATNLHIAKADSQTQSLASRAHEALQDLTVWRLGVVNVFLKDHFGFKLGDSIQVDYEYTHTQVSVEMVVDSIIVTPGPCFHLHGHKLRRDGRPGATTVTKPLHLRHSPVNCRVTPLAILA